MDRSTHALMPASFIFCWRPLPELVMERCACLPACLPPERSQGQKQAQEVGRLEGELKANEEQRARIKAGAGQ